MATRRSARVAEQATIAAGKQPVEEEEEVTAGQPRGPANPGGQGGHKHKCLCTWAGCQVNVEQWGHKLSSVGGTEAQLLVIRRLCAGDDELITKLSIGKGGERFSTMHVPAANKYWRGDQLRLNTGNVEVSLHHVSSLPRHARRASQLSLFQLNFSLTRATFLSSYEVGSPQ